MGFKNHKKKEKKNVFDGVFTLLQYTNLVDLFASGANKTTLKHQLRPFFITQGSYHVAINSETDKMKEIETFCSDLVLSDNSVNNSNKLIRAAQLVYSDMQEDFIDYLIKAIVLTTGTFKEYRDAIREGENGL